MERDGRDVIKRLIDSPAVQGLDIRQGMAKLEARNANFIR
jgi:hypothetical protein